MRTTRWNLTLGLGLVLIANMACNFSVSTANMSSLKLGKDKTVTQEASSFSPGDTIYAVATISNAPGKVKVKGRLSFEDVPGEQTQPHEQGGGHRHEREHLGVAEDQQDRRRQADRRGRQAQHDGHADGGALPDRDLSRANGFSR